ncbi:hypothetical protein HPB50_022774 [Hyalomma asiaticum]|uniref:Uncharacterized protein n=1 Tax=Hyalomma asiaticum TaxID=266040 RepID=A0ACB7TPV2_HYAAI|nr:hypothetical protein HPB50_022774 [Hyalomma asiaticum]
MAQRPSSSRSGVSGKRRVLREKEKLPKNAVIDYTRAVLPILERNAEEAHSEFVNAYHKFVSGEMKLHEFAEAHKKMLDASSALHHASGTVCETAHTAITMKHRDACLKRAALFSARKLVKRSCAWLRRGRSISSNRPPVRGLEPRTRPPTENSCSDGCPPQSQEFQQPNGV